jgi:hypothetical protein
VPARESLDARYFPLLPRLRRSQNGVLLPGTREEPIGGLSKDSAPFCCRLGVPLIASHQTPGLLPLGHTVPGSFTPEHPRLAKSLAIPAAGTPLRVRPSLRF